MSFHRPDTVAQMFFLVSKIAWSLVLPSNAALLFLLGGLLLNGCGWRLGRRLAAIGLAALLLGGFSPLGNLLCFPLEQRFASPAEPVVPGDVTGIIMLGGFEDPWVAAGRPGVALNEAAERLTAGLLLARRYPAAKVIFTGGSGSMIASLTAEKPIGDYLLASGIAADRIVLEHKSRTTWENATYLRYLLRLKPGERYVLVTSAYHMPRSVGTFRKVGFDVVPYPVDYRTRDAGDLLRPFWELPAGLNRTDLAAKEWIGLLAYWLSGRSSALWPGP